MHNLKIEFYLPVIMFGLNSPNTDTLEWEIRSSYNSPLKYSSASWTDVIFTGQEILLLDQYITIFKINFFKDIFQLVKK